MSSSFPPLRPAESPRIEPRSWSQSSQPYTPPRQRPQRGGRIWIHVVLFLATVASTTMMHGLGYAAALMAILTCHEFGHYFAARHHRVGASLPYFLPSPFLLGTFGAVIRMSPYIPNRRALFDIAAAGPIAGLVVALPLSFWGLMQSSVYSGTLPGTIELGEPLVFQAMQWMIFGSLAEGQQILLHDVAFAGWVGMFVTALNLLPISQLDGGHVVYSVFSTKSRYVSTAAFGALGLVVLTGGLSYLLFLILLWWLGINHPPTLNDGPGIGKQRRILAAVLLIVFIVCFTPSPLKF